MKFYKSLVIIVFFSATTYIIIYLNLYKITFYGKTIKLYSEKVAISSNANISRTSEVISFNQSTSNFETEINSTLTETISSQIASSIPKYRKREILTSKCHCRDDKVIFDEYDSYYEVQVVNNNSTLIKLSYKLSKDLLNRINCDLYNVLRRGKEQKIIGYSLYGTDRRYYNQLYQNVELAEKRYPSWVIRVHYNESILKNMSCKVECHQNKQKNNSFYDNIDFCQVSDVPNSLTDLKNTWNANYIHAMKWRWYSYLNLIFTFK